MASPMDVAKNFHSREFNRHYEVRWTGKHRVCQFDHIDELVCSNGAYFHVFLPADATGAELLAAIEEIKAKRDVMRWSWSYAPERPCTHNGAVPSYFTSYKKIATGVYCEDCGEFWRLGDESIPFNPQVALDLAS